MDCALIREDLFAYHFAETSEAEKDRVDAHLVECAACLKMYLALKRRIESGGTERPSDALRAKLRANVEKKFKPSKSARVVSFFRRRIPVYQGVAAAAVAAAITFGAPAAIHAVKNANDPDATRPTATEPRLDSARPSAESHNIF